MEAKKVIFPGRELPSYLGYGFLDRKSIRFENDVVSADYLLDCDKTLVHHVTWTRDRCELTTQLHGESSGVSWYPDLEHALVYDFMSRDIGKEQVFKYLADTAGKMRNIFIQIPPEKKPGVNRAIHYPAGMLMCFRLPVVEKKGKYNSFLQRLPEMKCISFYREKRVNLFFSPFPGSIDVTSFLMADFIVPLAYMTRAAEHFAAAGIIYPQTWRRMMIMDSNQGDTTDIQYFPFASDAPFAICYSDMSEIDLNWHAKIFLDNAESQRPKRNFLRW